MISIPRTNLDADLTTKLNQLTDRLRSDSADAALARKRWSAAPAERSAIRSHLRTMALGIERCMYCGDNIGSDIDHFEPISRAPLRTFDWLNHLLACGYCNTSWKHARFPCDSSGSPLLIDPTSDDPSEHLQLILRTGRYRELTEKGKTTIDVFGLNRGDLVRGRSDAYMTRGAVLCYAQLLVATGREQEGRQRLSALREEPHVSVLHAMLGVLTMDGAETVLGTDVFNALQDPKVRRLLDIGEQTPPSVS